ncbi:Lipopolysaccharide biosynthesis protein WzxC [Baekduia alba]|nr:Lipopolysaccharide biosynthesis protein WzxC [Baekduia alba]
MQVSRLIVALVLARLLAPDDFGKAAMVLVFSSLVLVFSDLGLGAALVQAKELEEDDRSTAFWTTVGSGVVFTGVAAACSGLLARFYGEPEVTHLCQVFSLVFIITSIGATQEALLVRAMSFRALEVRNMVGTAGGAIVGVTIALNGGGAWAIIGQQLAEATVGAALLWFASSWRPSLTFSRAALRRMWGFSGWLVGHRLLFYVHRNADNILIGRFVGAAALGAYTIAYNVMLVPFSRIAGPIQRVLWPAFAEMQDDPARIVAGWVRVTRVLAAAAVPALVGLVVVAPDFVAVVLGARWAEAAPLIQALAWVGILQTIQVLNIDILQARARTQLVFRYMVIFTCGHIMAFAIGLHWGVLGVAIAYAISSTFIEPILTYLTSRELGVSFWTIPRALWGVAQASALMAAATVAAHELLIGTAVGQLARLALTIAVGMLAYALAAWWRIPELRTEVQGALSEVRSGRGPVVVVAPEPS